MSQDDFTVANGAGATVRADINSNLQALASLSSGATAPSPSFAYQVWHDEANDVLKQRNAANTAWLVLPVRTGANVIDLTAAPSNLADHDIGKTYLLDAVTTGAFTVGFDTVANLRDGWYVDFLMVAGGARRIIDNAAPGNRVTLDGNGAELVGLEATYEFLTVGHSCRVINDGAQLRVVNEVLPEVVFLYQTTGAYTHTRPKGRQFAIEAGGTGGGGGGGRDGGAGIAGAGGGAGATLIMLGWDLSAQATVTGNVGAAGAGRTGTNGTGTAGGDTTLVLGAVTRTAGGGNGGQGALGTNQGGDGGTVTGTVDHALPGADGHYGEETTPIIGGAGAPSFWGGGTRGRVTGAATDATTYGAGGGGTGDTQDGGDGGPGVVWFKYRA